MKSYYLTERIIFETFKLKHTSFTLKKSLTCFKLWYSQKLI